MDSAEPLSSILWTLTPHPGESLRRDIRLPRAYRDIGIRCPVQTVYPHFDFLFRCFVFGPVSLAFQKISLGFWSLVFHYWWDGLFVPAATWGFCPNLS